MHSVVRIISSGVQMWVPTASTEHLLSAPLYPPMLPLVVAAVTWLNLPPAQGSFETWESGFQTALPLLSSETKKASTVGKPPFTCNLLTVTVPLASAFSTRP